MILIEKASKINLLDFKTPQMRAFHVTWMTFFLCFFGWFGIAPLMPVVRAELHLTKDQVANIMIASVSATIFARLLIGWVCDKFGPRLTYTTLLIIGSFPVMFIGLSNSYESFLLFRLAIGIVGASFVVTQYHTSVMFAPNIVGTANATVAGWGNLGGGITQMVMPLIFAGFVGIGYIESEAWRYAMVVPGVALFIMGFVYYFLTQDTPEGNVLELRKNNPEYKAKNPDVKGSFAMACKDYRTWILFAIYGACFGIEIMVDNIAALYFVDEFKLDLKTAGIIAGTFGLMNLFARALGGIFADKAGKKFGTRGKAVLLGIFLLMEGLGIVLFSRMGYLPLAVATLIGFAFFVKMSNGVTYSIVPFINKKALGSVAGIVGAGGNLGAVLATSVFKSYEHREGFLVIGIAVASVSFLAYFLKFTAEKKEDLDKNTKLELSKNTLILESEQKLEPVLAE